ncbi:MAG: response regulator [Myxococcaceae bacterium]|nr:response regulator [Myxococcaceae bacterium]
MRSGLEQAGPKILSVDEDRVAQAQVAQAFNDSGLFYRFVSSRAKVIGGIRQLKPDLLLIFSELYSSLTEDVLAAISGDVVHSRLPVVVLANDVSDRPFVAGLRTGVVALLQGPFSPMTHLPALRSVVQELPLRRGVVGGTGASTELARLVEHLRRTRRSGELTIDARSPNEGRASFVAGKVERASFGELSGIEALVQMVTRPKGHWHFSEVGGDQGDGAGVVIEVGDPDGVTQEIGVVVGVASTEEEEVTQVFEVPSLAPAPSAPPPPPVSAPRVLLVDDDEGLCRMFSTLFAKHGFAVTTAADGVEGFAAAETRPFDAVIADLNMPRMDGWGMLRQLRDDYRTKELPVAFLSCHDDYRESLRALDAGAQAYFSKGGRLDGLVNQVKKLFTPRTEAERQLAAGADFPVNLGVLGPQWLVSVLAKGGFTGVLEAADSWASYRLNFTEGYPRHCSAQAGRHQADGERAFNALIASRNAQGTVRFGNFPAPSTLVMPASMLLERACATLNENERRVREGLLVSATDLEVNVDLYAIYRHVGPQQWLEAARLVCEERVPPRELIARLDVSPLEVEDMLKDLLRRGVITLRRAA